MEKSKLSNTAKIALRIYRDRFKEYYLIAFINSFWLFFPIYGWAKYSAMMGLLARLAHGEVTDNPEPIKKAKQYIKSRTWLFFGAGLMETYTFYRKILLALIPLVIALRVGGRLENLSFLFNSLFWQIYAILFFYYYYWLLSHLFLYELPLAIEKNITVTKSRKIGWKLVKNLIFKLPVIIFSFSCAFVLLSYAARTINSSIYSGLSLDSITNLLNFSYTNILFFFLETLFFCGALFIPALSSAIGILFKIFFSSLSLADPDLLSTLLQIVTLIILQVAIGALFIPLWQSLKAVTYYQLNSVSEKLKVS